MGGSWRGTNFRTGLAWPRHGRICGIREAVALAAALPDDPGKLGGAALYSGEACLLIEAADFGRAHFSGNSSARKALESHLVKSHI